MEERRQYQRYKMGNDIYCEIIAGDGATYSAQLYDISITGARLHIDDAAAYDYIGQGETFQIYNYSQGGEYIAQNMTASAVWYSNNYYGIQYAAPIADSNEQIMTAYPSATPI